MQLGFRNEPEEIDKFERCGNRVGQRYFSSLCALIRGVRSKEVASPLDILKHAGMGDQRDLVKTQLLEPL